MSFPNLNEKWAHVRFRGVVLLIKDEQWPVARLIPISSGTGVEAQERRAAFVLLAVLSAVDEFVRALLKPLGAPAGKIETFVEVPSSSTGERFTPTE